MRNIEIYYPFNAEGRKVSIALAPMLIITMPIAVAKCFSIFFILSMESAIKFKVEEINVNHAILLLEVSSNRSTYVAREEKWLS